MNERVKVDAGRVEAQEAWFVWVSEPGFTYAPDWAAGGMTAQNFGRTN